MDAPARRPRMRDSARCGSNRVSVLSVRNLRRSYGNVKAVDGVSFDIDAGEVFGLLGPNGAGKSTTINMIATIVRPDGGEIHVNGAIAVTRDEYKRRIGFVPQELSLARRLTARENLFFFGRLYDLGGRALAARVDAMLDAVGLKDRGGDIVSTFSGGMLRRLNIACALLHRPDLILLDEPTAGVDPQARAYIFEIVRRLAEEGRAILYTTHYMEEAQRLCRRTAIIDRGRILAIGTLAELTEQSGARLDLTVEGEDLTAEQAERLAARLGDIPYRWDGREVHFNPKDERVSVVVAARAADDLGIRLRAVRLDAPNLETVFLQLTGRALRD